MRAEKESKQVQHNVDHYLEVGLSLDCSISEAADLGSLTAFLSALAGKMFSMPPKLWVSTLFWCVPSTTITASS